MILISVLLSLVLSTQATEPRVVTIAVDNTMKYSITAIKAQPGETLKVVLQSKATMPKTTTAHNFVLLAQGTNVAAFLKAGTLNKNTDFIAPDQKDRVIASTPLAGPDETVEVTFKAPDRPGTYEFICSFPGHYALGMKGTLTVR
jgi:azurin